MSNSIISNDFIVCPCCGAHTFAGASGICPINCDGFVAAVEAREASLPSNLEPDDIELDLTIARRR